MFFTISVFCNSAHKAFEAYIDAQQYIGGSDRDPTITNRLLAPPAPGAAAASASIIFSLSALWNVPAFQAHYQDYFLHQSPQEAEATPKPYSQHSATCSLDRLPLHNHHDPRPHPPVSAHRSDNDKITPKYVGSTLDTLR
ncbi:BQ5605_C007g04390 [Microbotryum silenes-dioicae]|uniref:BQ5605_C007g04385 protein n=1 Tax=Microbotryum silenes-dioicae TaxID=796604 RepID=A0A2X0M718_9BASI|nr:BQ5605_C007g04385 [Microbotryum silenes-dioicae]SGY60185.1 BQ5605_C007g04390 [Microbotryum silenes-dioicae]